MNLRGLLILFGAVLMGAPGGGAAAGELGAPVVIGGETWRHQDGGQAWSVRVTRDAAGAAVVRQALHGREHWAHDDPDLPEARRRQRSEFMGQTVFALGQPIRWDFHVRLGPHVPRTDPDWGSGPVIFQAHFDDVEGAAPNSPPFEAHLSANAEGGEDLSFWAIGGPDVRAAAPPARLIGLVRDVRAGRDYAVSLALTFDPVMGSARIAVDGAPLADWRGPMGMGGAGVYLKFGLYRGPNTRDRLWVEHSRMRVSAGG